MSEHVLPWLYNGFPGRVLWVNLTTMTTQVKEIPHAWCLEGMGGKGLATKLLVEWDTTVYDEALTLKSPVNNTIDTASHPSNPLLIMTGPYQGTKIGSSGRAVIVSRSPLTQCYIDTYIGGNFGHELRQAGWDGIFVTGASQQLTHLEILDGQATLHTVPHLKGKTTWDVEQALVGLGECMSIGPAGENAVRIASPLTDGRRAAGRGGTGAVFGMKKLKAITVQASSTSKQATRVASHYSLDGAIKEQRTEMGARRKAGDPFYQFGTSRGPLYASENGRMPTANYSSTDARIPEFSQMKAGLVRDEDPRTVSYEGRDSVDVQVELSPYHLSGEHWHEALSDAKQSGCCTPCPIACEAADRPIIDGEKIRGRPKHLTRVDRPEYETLALLGSNLGIDSSLAVMDGNDACNLLGIDTISAGAVLGLMCELSERGWLPDHWSTHFPAPFDFGRFKQGDSVPWAFSTPELPPLALHCLAHATPGDGTVFGTLTAGAVATSQWVESVTGHPATRLTAHCKGLDLPAWDPRGLRGNGMAYMTANVGASHMRAGYKTPTGLPSSSAVELMPELIESQHSIVIRDSMILCAFAKGATPDHVMLEAWKAITGEQCEWDDLLARASRQWDRARQWNVQQWLREGKSPREQDLLSWRLRYEPVTSGVAKGMVSFVSNEDEALCLDSYYSLRGWDQDGQLVSLSYP